MEADIAYLCIIIYIYWLRERYFFVRGYFSISTMVLKPYISIIVHELSQ